MTALVFHTVDSADRLVSPEEFSDVGIESPALALFTDFKRHEPLAIDGWMRAVDAERCLRLSHTRLRLVLDRRGAFIGTVSLEDVSEEKLLRRMGRGESRYDLRVMDMMVPREEIRALSYRDLCDATVGDVLEVLRGRRDQHCLVADFDTGVIRGMISAGDVARRLDVELEQAMAPTFADVLVAH